MAVTRKKRSLGIRLTVAVVVIVGGAAFRWQQSPSVQASSRTVLAERKDRGPPIPLSATQSETAPTTIPSPRQRMKSAKDWYALAKELLPQAKDGNAEAEYVLFMTYRQCRARFGAHFETLEAARQFAIENNLSVDRAESGFKQCHGFFNDDASNLGDPWDWLQKATDAGYAPAQAQTARERLSQDQLKVFIRAGAQPNESTAALPPIGGDANPRDLLTAAVQSADYEVLEEIGNLQHMLNPNESREATQIDNAAWIYVACQRGADCSVFGPGVVTNCGPNDGQCTPVPERFLKQVNYNWAPVQDRVNRINAALNAKQWDQLPGLTSGG